MLENRNTGKDDQFSKLRKSNKITELCNFPFPYSHIGLLSTEYFLLTEVGDSLMQGLQKLSRVHFKGGDASSDPSAAFEMYILRNVVTSKIAEP